MKSRLTAVFLFLACGAPVVEDAGPVGLDAGSRASESSDDAGAQDGGGDVGARDGDVDAGAQDGGPASCARVGWFADLTTRFHGVRGRVTLTTDCTVRVTGFSYDGQGIDVRFYGARAGQPFADGAAMGPQLFRPQRPWVDDALEFSLPTGLAASELNAISVWCVDARVDFGSGTFRAP